MTEYGDLPASPIFAVDGGGIVIFPDVEAAASWMEVLEVASGAYQGYDAIGRRLRATAAGGSMTIELAEHRPAHGEDLEGALRTFLLSAGEEEAADPACGLPCLVELSRRHMHRPAARWPRLKSLFNPLYHPRNLRRAEAVAAAVPVSVGLPIAGLWEIRGHPGWFGLSRALIHEGVPLLILATFMGVALPDVGLPRRHGVLVLVPFLSLPVVVRAFWRAASLPDRYWARRW